MTTHKPRYSPEVEVGKFWSRVDRSSGDGCWPWIGGRISGDRGVMQWRGRQTLAYRVSWELEHGEAPPADKHVCHHCDNPRCVRPSHLFLGRDLENVHDMWAKGRAVPPPVHEGLSHHNARLPDEVIREARESFAAGVEDCTTIALRLGHARSSVRAWLTGATRLAAGGPIADDADGKNAGKPAKVYRLVGASR